MSDSFARAVALHRARALGEIRPMASVPRPEPATAPAAAAPAAAAAAAAGEIIAVDFAPRRIDRAVGRA